MPSHGSLQQAVKVRPERGEKEGKEAEKKKNFFQTHYRRRLRNILSPFFLCLHLISINSTTKCRAAHLECESVSLSKSPCFFLGTKCLHSIWHLLPSPSQCHFKKQKNCLHILASKKSPFCISLATAEKQWRSFCMCQVVVDILR